MTLQLAPDQISHSDIMAEWSHPANTEWKISADGAAYISFAVGSIIKESDFYGQSAVSMLPAEFLSWNGTASGTNNANLADLATSDDAKTWTFSPNSLGNVFQRDNSTDARPGVMCGNPCINSGNIYIDGDGTDNIVGVMRPGSRNTSTSYNALSPSGRGMQADVNGFTPGGSSDNWNVWYSSDRGENCTEWLRYHSANRILHLPGKGLWVYGSIDNSTSSRAEGVDHSSYMSLMSTPDGNIQGSTFPFFSSSTSTQGWSQVYNRGNATSDLWALAHNSTTGGTAQNAMMYQYNGGTSFTARNPFNARGIGKGHRACVDGNGDLYHNTIGWLSRYDAGSSTHNYVNQNGFLPSRDGVPSGMVDWGIVANNNDVSILFVQQSFGTPIAGNFYVKHSTDRGVSFSSTNLGSFSIVPEYASAKYGQTSTWRTGNTRAFAPSGAWIIESLDNGSSWDTSFTGNGTGNIVVNSGDFYSGARGTQGTINPAAFAPYTMAVNRIHRSGDNCFTRA